MKDRTVNRKKLTIFLSACIGAILFIALALVILLRGDEPRKPYVPPRYEAGDFSPIDWEEDISLDDIYMSDYDRTVRYEDENGVMYELTDADYDDGGAQAAFIYEVLASIRNGDADEYNAALSDYYKDAVGAKPAFTQQKLYDIFFKPCVPQDGGDAGVLFAYRVNFKIKDNNGTFRDDVESDMLRHITYYLRETDNGWEIYTITYPNLDQ